MEKIDKSSPDFKDTRVTSCSSVFMKNGQAVCVAFKTSKKSDAGVPVKSSERASFSQ
jgi:hypothetical protein